MTDDRSLGMTTEAMNQEAAVFATTAGADLMAEADFTPSEDVYTAFAKCPDVWIRDHDLFGQLEVIVNTVAYGQRFFGGMIVEMEGDADPLPQRDATQTFELFRLAHHVLRGLLHAAHVQYHAGGMAGANPVHISDELSALLATVMQGDKLPPRLSDDGMADADDTPSPGQYL